MTDAAVLSPDPTAGLRFGAGRAFEGARLRALPVAFGVSAVIWLGPYLVWGAPVYYRMTVVVLAVLFAAALGAGRIRLARADVGVAALFAVAMAYFATGPAGGLLAPATSWVTLFLFVLLPVPTKARAFRAFTWVFALSLAPGIVAWVLSGLGADLPWSYLYAKRLDASLLTTGTASYYRQYLGSVVRDFGVFTLASGSTLFRLHAMYEEPGVVGTVAGLLLVAGRFQLRGRPDNVILLAGGLMSLSLAFYAVAFVYALLRRPVAILVATALAVAAFAAFGLGERLPLVQALILDRLAPGSTSLTGEYRTSPVFLSLYDEFWRADLWTRLFGSARDITTLVNTGTFSYQVVVFQYGIAGFAALLAVLAVGALRVSWARDTLILLGAVFASVYQRPNVFGLPFVLLLIGGAAVLRAGPRNRPPRRPAVAPAGGRTPTYAPAGG